MKKIVFVLLLVFSSWNIYAQQGDLSVGVKSGYVTKYEDLLYGLDLAYQFNEPFEIAFTGLMNPNISLEDEFLGVKNKLSLYSANLDLRIYLIPQRSWATGPVLGAQYLSVNNKTIDFDSYNVLGFNIGWHIRANITDNLKINGGWRYTNAKEGASHNFFYAGLTYTFELF
jgi:opacity protein-like surface antigen